ncbi:MAG TPA: hypothetical protein VIG24_19305 [Acidimicrobiia bacterium]
MTDIAFSLIALVVIGGLLFDRWRIGREFAAEREQLLTAFLSRSALEFTQVRGEPREQREPREPRPPMVGM